jgi:hypothetical protein
MKTRLEKGTLFIEVPINEDPQPSKSGNTLILAGTGGFVPTDLKFNGKAVRISVNATVKP